MTDRTKTIAGYLFALAGLVWVFHDIDLRALGRQMDGLQWTWLLPAVACDVLSYVCEGERWRLLLHRTGRLPLRRAVQAIYAGLFTNEVVPLRFGELVRAYLVSRWLRRPLTTVIPSMAVGRLIDAVWLALGVGVLFQFLPLPADLARAAEIFGALIGMLAAVFAYVVIRPPHHWCAAGQPRLLKIAGRVLTGIGEIGIGCQMVAASLYSLACVILQASAFWFVMGACRLPVGYAAAAAVFLIVHLGTAIPNAPANVGSFQFFTVLGLQLFGVAKSEAAGFSILVFLVLTVPLWAIGLFSISRSGVTLAQIRTDLNGMRRAADSI